MKSVSIESGQQTMGFPRSLLNFSGEGVKRRGRKKSGTASMSKLLKSLLFDSVPNKEIVSGKAEHEATISEGVGELDEIPL